MSNENAIIMIIIMIMKANNIMCNNERNIMKIIMNNG